MSLDQWTTWTPRAEIAPRFRTEPSGGREGRDALRIDCDRRHAYGVWRRALSVTEGNWYRFRAAYRTAHVAQPRKCVSARILWQDEQGERVRPPDYTLDKTREGEWRCIEYVTQAPAKAKRACLELAFGWCDRGIVWWDDVRLEETVAPKQRTVQAATLFLRPRGTKSAGESVEAFCRLVESAQQPLDLICLPEGVTVVGNGKPYAEVAETAPGPTTERLGKLAQARRAYVVAGIYERVGQAIYNTAVLIGRDGALVGTYRKTHLPYEEVEGGLTPGDSYPVFETDFGKVGLMICWDLQFPEPARAMAGQGAEILLLPIWGGSETLARARAIENHVFLISATYDMRSFIVDPTGAVLAEATQEHPFVQTEIALDKQFFQPWLGDMQARTWRERRPDIPVWQER